MTTAYGTSIDVIAEGVLRDEVTEEVKRLLHKVAPKHLTACELFAILAIARVAEERLEAQQRPPAPVLELRVRASPVSSRKSGRVRNRPSC
jgi:hypothetical protein